MTCRLYITVPHRDNLTPFSRTIRAPEDCEIEISPARRRTGSRNGLEPTDTRGGSVVAKLSKIGPGRRLAAIGCILGMAILVLGPDPAEAQTGDTATSGVTTADRPLATRAELESQLETLKERLASDPDRPSRELERRIEQLRDRLQSGDFRAGDLVELRVRSDPDLTGSFSVNRQRQLELETLPSVDLGGVLYSEIESTLRDALDDYIRDPNVRARVLLRVAVVGGVNSPGYYDLSPSTTLSEALMQAGGPSQQAKLDEMEFRREGRDVLSRGEGPVESLTLAELGARRGDQLYVPPAESGTSVMGVLGVVSGLAGTAWAISRIF